MYYIKHARHVPPNKKSEGGEYMAKKIEFVVTEEIWDLLGRATLSDPLTFNNYARTLFLKGLAAEFGIHDEDETAKRIEKLTV